MTPNMTAAMDSRKRRIRGLWKRGDRYYAQVRLKGESPRKIPMRAATLEEAKAELEKIRTDARAHLLPSAGSRPDLATFIAEYLNSPAHFAKKTGTRKDERNTLAHWSVALGALRIDRVTETHIRGQREKRLRAGVTARTVNKEAVYLYQVLKLAHDRAIIDKMPRVRQLKQAPPAKRPLLSRENVDAILAHCRPPHTINGQLLWCYLRFLAFCGAREQEALAVKWSDVDWSRRLVTIGADGNAKNRRARSVNFNRDLEATLRFMRRHLRQPDCSYLFPSPHRGDVDRPARKLRESFNSVREAACVEWAGFHDFRHFFASSCVMAGIDFMTIASWLGHQDGGVLVGRVYGHLADEHKRRMAGRVKFS